MPEEPLVPAEAGGSSEDEKKKKKKKEKIRSAWISFIGRITAQIVGAVAAQWKLFLIEFTRTLPIVIGHNALGLSLGYGASVLARLSVPDRRAVVIEGGMQNSGLALGIVAAQFNSDLVMVAVAGLWGIWHIGSGGSLALLWRHLDRRSRQLN